MAEGIKDQMTVSFDYYSDNVDVEVYSPLVALTKRLSEHWGINASFRADAISAASMRNGNGKVKDGVIVDAVSGASGRYGFDDFRVAPTVSLMYEEGDFSANFGSYYSNEVDYDALAGFGSLTYGFNDANTIISIGGSYEKAKWSPTTNRVLYPTDEKTQTQGNASVMQLINPTSYVQLRFSYTYQDGFLASPYHYLVNDTIAQFDRYPESRKAYATALQYVSQVAEDVSINLEYRYYDDDWDMQSHTVTGKVFYNVMDNLMLGASARWYNQSKASFVKNLNEYNYDDAYIVSDYRLTDLETRGAGLSLSYRPGFIEDENILIKMSYDWYETDDNAYIENWYGKSKIEANMATIALIYDF